jgi:uncharacterized protein YggE
MNKRWIICVVIVPAMLLAGCTAATATPGGSAQPCSVNCYAPTQVNLRTLSVIGEGKVNVTPDVAFIYMGVITRDASINKAWDDNSAKMQAVIAALGAQGIKPEDMRTDFNVSQQEKYDANGQPSGVITYIVTNSLTVTARDLTKIGQVLGAAQAAGVNSVAGVTFALEDPTGAISQARALAVANARTRADEIAKGLGVTITRVLTVNEYGETVPVPVDKGFSTLGIGGGGGSTVPIQVGTWQVSMTVSVVFEIE